MPVEANGHSQLRSFLRIQRQMKFSKRELKKRKSGDRKLKKWDSSVKKKKSQRSSEKETKRPTWHVEKRWSVMQKRGNKKSRSPSTSWREDWSFFLIVCKQIQLQLRFHCRGWIWDHRDPISWLRILLIISLCLQSIWQERASWTLTVKLLPRF